MMSHGTSWTWKHEDLDRLCPKISPDIGHGGRTWSVDSFVYCIISGRKHEGCLWTFLGHLFGLDLMQAREVFSKSEG
jgi:hypothetical protein